ncbi:PEP-CTERM sorting domain-containing protein [Rubritalea tangerina]|uniref:PEP-CTERM sorting domain-containing protein n=2 Tax=Rubritalea tangerina TaxID=430798 RepID=A0ABW4Z6E3_9BACT
MKKTCLAVASLAALSASSQAAVIIDASNITYTGSQAANVLGPITTITDGSGLSAPLTVANLNTVTHANFSSTNSWATTNPNGTGDFFLGGGAQGTVTFEITFDNAYTIDTFTTWGYGWNADQGNNASAITIDYGVGNYLSSTNLNLPLTTLGNPQTVNLGGITADRVRITVTDNHFGASGGGDRVGIAEIAFVGDVASIPEPSATALIGLGGLALILRRRK